MKTAQWLRMLRGNRSSETSGLLHGAAVLDGTSSRVPISNISKNQHKESLLTDVKYEHVVVHEGYGVYGYSDLTSSQRCGSFRVFAL